MNEGVRLASFQTRVCKLQHAVTCLLPALIGERRNISRRMSDCPDEHFVTVA